MLSIGANRARSALVIVAVLVFSVSAASAQEDNSGFYVSVGAGLGSASTLGPVRSTQLAEELDRQVAHHTAPQLPPREPALEARLARCLQPFLHVLDHVHRRRPTEPLQERPRQGKRLP